MRSVSSYPAWVDGPELNDLAGTGLTAGSAVVAEGGVDNFRQNPFLPTDPEGFIGLSTLAFVDVESDSSVIPGFRERIPAGLNRAAVSGLRGSRL